MSGNIISQLSSNEPEDDFSNDKEISQLRAEKARHLKMLLDCLDMISEAFGDVPESDEEIPAFEMLNSLKDINYGEFRTGVSNRREIYFGLISYYTHLRTAKTSYGSTNEYLCGFVTLPETFPHSYIQPETLALKMVGLFTKSELKVKDCPKFSRRFYILTEDKDQLAQKFANRDLNKLAVFKDAEFEFSGKYCCFRVSRKAASLQETEKFISLAKTLSTLF